jgi:hypothetical protein
MRLFCCLVCVGMAVMTGCVTVPMPLYSWENFPRQQYDTLLSKGTRLDDQIRELQAHADKARVTDAALPPGLRAHLGMLYLSSGDPGSAREQWLAEKAAFPEATPYIDHLLKRLNVQSSGGVVK